MFTASFLTFWLFSKLTRLLLHFYPHTIRSHLKIRSSKLVYVLFLSLQLFDMLPCVFIASEIFPLLLIQVDKVFFGTWDFEDPPLTTFNAAYFSLIDFVLSLLFVAPGAIVKWKQYNPEINFQYNTHQDIYKLQLNSNIKIKLFFAFQCKGLHRVLCRN